MARYAAWMRQQGRGGGRGGQRPRRRVQEPDQAVQRHDFCAVREAIDLPAEGLAQLVADIGPVAIRQPGHRLFQAALSRTEAVQERLFPTLLLGIGVRDEGGGTYGVSERRDIDRVVTCRCRFSRTTALSGDRHARQNRTCSQSQTCKYMCSVAGQKLARHVDLLKTDRWHLARKREAWDSQVRTRLPGRGTAPRVIAFQFFTECGACERQFRRG